MAKAGWRMPPAADRDVAIVAALPSLTALLRHRAAVQPDDRAYVALSDRGQEDSTVTFAELDRRAKALARQIAHRAFAKLRRGKQGEACGRIEYAARPIKAADKDPRPPRRRRLREAEAYQQSRGSGGSGA